MREGARVEFLPNPVSLALYSYAVPARGTCGSVTALPVGAGRRTSLPGPGGGLLFVVWDDGLVCGVSHRDVRRVKH